MVLAHASVLGVSGVWLVRQICRLLWFSLDLQECPAGMNIHINDQDRTRLMSLAQATHGLSDEQDRFACLLKGLIKRAADYNCFCNHECMNE